MTKKKVTIQIKPPKKRMHYVLFAPDSPFKGRKVEDKKFKRKPRNQKGHEE